MSSQILQTLEQYGREPNPFQTGKLARPMVQRNLNIMNADVQHNILSVRQNNVDTGTPETVIGSVSDPKTLSILRGELVFSHSAMKMFQKRTALGTDARPSVFSSFNGMKIPRGATDETFGDFFDFMGISIGPYHPGSSTQEDIGVTVAPSGQMSIRNLSPYHIPAGILVGYKLPSVSDKVRASERPNRYVKDTELPPDKQVATVVPVMPSDQIQTYRLGMNYLMTKALDSDLYFARIAHANPSSSSSSGASPKSLEARISGALAQMMASHTIGVLSVLMEYGIVQMVDMDNWMDGEVYRRIGNSIRENPLPSLAGKSVEWDSTGKATVSQMNNIDSAATSKKRIVDLGLIAALMGFSHTNKSNVTYSPSSTFVKAVTGRSLNDLIRNDSVRGSYKLRRSLDEYNTKKKMTENANISLKVNQTLNTLDKAMSNSTTQFLNMMALIRFNEAKRIIGMSTNNSSPGSYLDLSFN